MEPIEDKILEAILDLTGPDVLRTDEALKAIKRELKPMERALGDYARDNQQLRKALEQVVKELGEAQYGFEDRADTIARNALEETDGTEAEQTKT